MLAFFFFILKSFFFPILIIYAVAASLPVGIDVYVQCYGNYFFSYEYSKEFVYCIRDFETILDKYIIEIMTVSFFNVY